MSSPEEPNGPGVPGGGVTSTTPPSTLDKVRAKLGGAKIPPPSTTADGEGDEEEDGMLRMSFLDHLNELRSRIIKCLIGIAVAFGLSLTFCKQLWGFVSQPAVKALTDLGINPPKLAMIEPLEGFMVIYFKLPILCAIFLACPWVLYQVWAFIAPGLYRRERKWAAPFILTSAGLFILGGVFAYFVLFRFSLTFLLGIGLDQSVTPYVSIGRYFDLFVNITLGVALVFELPVLMFFLTLLRVTSPAFLLRNSRYAILVIFIIAALVTPTPDPFNLMILALPMCLLFFLGAAASYVLVLHREKRRLPWGVVLSIVIGVLCLFAAGLYLAITRYGYILVPHWPFLTK